MNKTEFIDKVASAVGGTKVDAAKYVNGFIEAVESGLSDGEDIALTGFGTFKAKKRPARMGRNPATGEALKIKARVSPSFSPGKGLKDALN